MKKRTKGSVIRQHRREGLGWRHDGFGDWTTEAIFAKLAELGVASAPERFKTDALAAGEPPPPMVAGPEIGRDEPCPCGSGNKYKKCCGK